MVVEASSGEGNQSGIEDLSTSAAGSSSVVRMIEPSGSVPNDHSSTCAGGVVWAAKKFGVAGTG